MSSAFRITQRSLSPLDAGRPPGQPGPPAGHPGPAVVGPGHQPPVRLADRHHGRPAAADGPRPLHPARPQRRRRQSPARHRRQRPDRRPRHPPGGPRRRAPGGQRVARRPTDREALAAQVDGLRASLLAVANTKYLQQPIFAGTAGAAAAYDASGAYQGDAGAVTPHHRPRREGHGQRHRRGGVRPGRQTTSSRCWPTHRRRPAQQPVRPDLNRPRPARRRLPAHAERPGLGRLPIPSDRDHAGSKPGQPARNPEPALRGGRRRPARRHGRPAAPGGGLPGRPGRHRQGHSSPP